MNINVAAAKRNPGLAYTFAIEAELPPFTFAGEKNSLTKPVHFEGKVVNTSASFLVQGEIEATLNLQCSRCLETFTYHLQAPYEEEFYSKDLGQGEQDELSKEKALSGTYFEGDMIDLTPSVVQDILINMPMKPVCREVCKGLCPQCGQNLNIIQCECDRSQIDPRLSVLEKLLGDRK